MNRLELFLQRLIQTPAVLVVVAAVRGSVPREVGAWMAVFAQTEPQTEPQTLGTVGGGQLEFDAVRHARSLMQNGAVPGLTMRRYALGPTLGQCCGGDVQLSFEPVSAADIAPLRQRLQPVHQPVALFGGGHVGQALVRVLAELPFTLRWIDSRGEVFPRDVPAHVVCEHSEPVQRAVPMLPAGARVLVMSFSHAEDLDVVAACLLRQRQQADLPFVGLIGSRTKWASFRQRLLARGFTEAELAQISCPIGVPGVLGKQPEVIAVAVAAQLLQTLAPR